MHTRLDATRLIRTIVRETWNAVQCHSYQMHNGLQQLRKVAHVYLAQHPLALTRAPQTESRRLLPPVSLAKARSRAPRNNLPSGSTHVDLFNCFLCQKQGLSPPLRRCSQCEIAYYFRT